MLGPDPAEHLAELLVRDAARRMDAPRLSFRRRFGPIVATLIRRGPTSANEIAVFPLTTDSAARMILSGRQVRLRISTRPEADVVLSMEGGRIIGSFPRRSVMLDDSASWRRLAELLEAVQALQSEQAEAALRDFNERIF